VTEELPLHAQLSHALVAFTIEFDNEFEHRMPHRTTRHGSTPGMAHPPYLVSMAMWVNCMRFVPEEGITAAELARLAQVDGPSMAGQLKRMSEWWGYLVAGAGPAAGGAKAPRPARLVRPTAAGRRAQAVWAPLEREIEDRWRARFGGAEIGRLRTALWGIAGQLDVELPDYLPVGDPRLDPRQPAPDVGAVPDVTLPALLSKVLSVFALEFQDESDLSLSVYTAGRMSQLPICANILRVLHEDGVPARDLPALTGVAKMTIDNWLGILAKRGYAVVGPGPAGGRARLARLTPKGRRARETYLRWAAEAGQRWDARFGEAPMRALRESAGELTGAPGPDQSPLWPGLEPYPGGWRSAVPRPQTLPHFPVISARGGFPDGN
jgi:DNA-binding MarR family transcriptional regulator